MNLYLNYIFFYFFNILYLNLNKYKYKFKNKFFFNKMENNCINCKKKFSSKESLNLHLKTSTCLKKKDKKSFECEYCNKILSSYKRLLSHIDICKLKDKNDITKYKSLSESNNKKAKKYKELFDQKEKEYKELFDQKEKECKEYKELLSKKDQEINIIKEQTKEYIQDLKNQLKDTNNTIAEIAKQPKTISNNDNRIKNQNSFNAKVNIQQTFDINDVKKISNILEHHLTPDVLANGQKGLAEMLKKHLLQNEKGEPIYGCTDVSRQKFEFINKHGYIESDPKAAKLITSLNNANIFDVAHTTGKKLWETEDGVNHDSQHVHMPRVTEVLDIKDDSSKFRSHLASITSR